MCEYCKKRACPDGCPNNYVPRGKKRTSDSGSKRVGFKIAATCIIGDARRGNLMNIPLINKELTMKS